MAKLTRRFPTLHFDHMIEASSTAKAHLFQIDHFCATEEAQKELAQGKQFYPAPWLRSIGCPPAYSLCLEVMWVYRNYGQQNYVLGPALQDVLLNTSLKGIERSALNLPYPCFYIALENSNIDLWGGPDTQWHRCGGVYVYYCPANESIYLFMWGKPNMQSKIPGDDATAWWRFKLDELDKHEDIESYIRYTRKTEPSNDDASWISVPERFDDKVAESEIQVARVAFNLIMYLQTQQLDAEVETPEIRKRNFDRKFKGKNLNKGVAKLAHRDLIKGGKHTVTYLDQKREDETKQTRKAGSASQRRRWVQGHWQRYWYGSGEKRRRKWKLKEPYLQNRDAPADVERRYYVSHKDGKESR